MATLINTECINCAACEPECPNTAIYQGGIEWLALDGSSHAALSNELFYIVPEKCTECVGFFDQEACAKVCPVDACVPDPDRPETEAALLVRAREIHPDKAIPDDAPSRFRAGAGAGGAGEAAAAAPAAAAPKAAAAPAAAPKAAAKPAGRVEKPVAKPRKERPLKSFAGQLPVEYDQLLQQLGAPRRGQPSAVAKLGLPVLALAQGLLGALPAGMKRQLERRVADTRFFSAQLATAANAMLNLVLYPVALVALSVARGESSFFSAGVRWPLMLGVTLGVAEAVWRLRETVFSGVPIAETPLRAAVYGPLIAPLGGVAMLLVGNRGTDSGVGNDGFSQERESFDDKLERARRYGEVYQLVDRDDAYLLRLEFPRTLPPSSLRVSLGLPEEMPDYDYDLTLQGATFVVHGRVDDPDVKKITGAAGSFPSTFVTRIPLQAAVQGFRHRYRDKVLEVILPKAVA